MSSKDKKGSSSSPSSRRSSQITFEGVNEVKDKPSKDSKSSKDSKTKKKGGSKSGSREGSKTSISSDKRRPSATSTPNKKSSEPMECDPNVTEIRKPSTRYVPIPYTFRVPQPQPLKGLKGRPAKCPPYQLQLDHTLAVVWTLFSSEQATKPLGIAQLQWALEFLKGIHNRKGDHPKDVSLCIDAIQDELIQQYSDMVDDIKAVRVPCSKAVKSRSSSKTSLESCTKSDTTNGSCDDETCIKKYGVDTDESDSMITREIPFSVNYADMIKKSPPCLQQLYKCQRGSACSTNTNQQVRIAGLDSMGFDTNISKENMVEVLKSWRREQVDKIQAELKRLRSIENFIGNVETEDFVPYLEDGQLDDLVAKSPNKCGQKSSTHSSSSKKKKSKNR